MTPVSWGLQWVYRHVLECSGKQMPGWQWLMAVWALPRWAQGEGGERRPCPAQSGASRSRGHRLNWPPVCGGDRSPNPELPTSHHQGSESSRVNQSGSSTAGKTRSPAPTHEGDTPHPRPRPPGFSEPVLAVSAPAPRPRAQAQPAGWVPAGWPSHSGRPSGASGHTARPAPGPTERPTNSSFLAQDHFAGGAPHRHPSSRPPTTPGAPHSPPAPPWSRLHHGWHRSALQTPFSCPSPSCHRCPGPADSPRCPLAGR